MGEREISKDITNDECLLDMYEYFDKNKNTSKISKEWEESFNYDIEKMKIERKMKAKKKGKAYLEANYTSMDIPFNQIKKLASMCWV